MDARWLRLNGRDLPVLGPLACGALPGAGALALSRGLWPKRYPHRDPNEDGALLYAAEGRRLLAVVDGHEGALAAELALDLLLARAASLLDASADEFTRAVVALVREIATRLTDRSRSRTCLALARLEPGRCDWASFGDTTVLRSSDATAQTVANDLFLGTELRVRVLPPELWRGAFTPSPEERLALLSDGVTDFHPEGAGLSAALARANGDDLAVARALCETAMHAGAGDNVAAVVSSA